ncbi:MAG: carboxypeptidase-like regulatory domain-containing protein [Flavobacteriaceae bacterium]|nr:carboxypeptidase-like regulatory domain-containing protein [Flavobacteriaceae bacterium]
MKLTLVISLFFFQTILLAQQVERVEVSGKITAPKGEDVEGISIYNISSEKGAVTNIEGEFKLKVAEFDHIQITALQFNSFKIAVTQADIESKELRVYLNPNVNQLDPVTIRNHDLTGYLEIDAKNIKTSVFTQEFDLSYAALEFGYNFENDGQSPVTGNAAQDALGVNSVPVASIDLIKLIELFLPKRKPSSRQIYTSRKNIANVLLEQYKHGFFVETFDIPYDKVNDFVYFTEENGLTISMLKRGKEMELLTYLFEQSEIYKKRLEGQN